MDPGEPANMSLFVALEWTQRAPHRFCLKDAAFRNMFFMLITLETSHFEMSLLNDVAPWNIPVSLGVRVRINTLQHTCIVRVEVLIRGDVYLYILYA